MRDPVVLGVVLLVGLAVGWLLRGRLARRAYRLADEAPLPGPRTWWIVPVTALGGMAMWWSLAPRQSVVTSSTYLVCGWVMVVLAAIDLDVHRLPDAIQLPAYPVLLALLAVASAAGGTWGSLGRAALGGLALLAFFLVLALVGAGMGLGDVKLAGLLGLLLGWLSWAHVLVGAVAGILLGGIVGAVLLATRTAGRSSEFAYGPPLLAGAALAIVALG